MKKMNEINWFRTPIRTELLLSKIKSTPSLLAIVKSKKDLTETLKDEFRQRLHGSINNFLVLFITAEMGNWKSSVGQSIATELDPNFTANNIFFSYDEFETIFKESKPKTFHIMDELIFQAGSGSNRIMNTMQTLIETLRKRQNSLILISPNLKYFNEDLFHFVIEPFDNAILATCPYNQKLHEPRECQCNYEKNYTVKEAYCRTVVRKNNEYIGFYIVPISWDNPVWNEYSIKKDAFNESVAKQEHNRTDYRGKSEIILKNPDNINYKTKKALKILVYQNFPNLTIQEAEMVIEHICLQRRLDEANGVIDL